VVDVMGVGLLRGDRAAGEAAGAIATLHRAASEGACAGCARR
jgi:hypothetical protein